MGWLIGGALLAVFAAPALGALLTGLDRKLTARMQARIGPPVLQPVYDVVKLLGKKPLSAGGIQLVFAACYLLLIVTAVVLFALRLDLLVVLFVLFFGGLCLALGALSVKSPYSQLGGNRELLQFMAYEPILLLATVPIALKTGGFEVSQVFDYGSPLLPALWPTFIALLIALAIVLRKSPFDISGAQHAHQELVRGVTTEYSGPYLALIEIGHWYERVLVLALLGLFWVAGLWWLSIVIPLAAWFLMILLDNVAARLTWSWMLKFSWGAGITLAGLNALFVNLGWM